jgi:excisionase family DNA binding protein
VDSEANVLTLEELMTAEQIAALLLLRRSTVEDYARRGLLPSIKLGRHRRFVRVDVVAALEGLRRTQRGALSLPRPESPG